MYKNVLRTQGIFTIYFRLQELQQIRSNPVNTYLSEEELVNQAGFSDYCECLRMSFREELKAR